MLKLCVAFALLISACVGQAIFNGPCEQYNAHVVKNFDIPKYMGHWYEIKRFETFFQKGQDCVSADYSINVENNITVVNKARILKTNQDVDIEGYAYQEDPDWKLGMFRVQFPLSPVGDYWVIGTDYENYSVVWTCHRGEADYNYQYMWILSRESKMTPEIEDKVKQIILDAKIHDSQLRVTANDEKTCGKKK